MEQIAIGQEPSTEQSKQDRKKLMASINELKKESERIENSNRRRQRLRDEQFNGENEKLLNEILLKSIFDNVSLSSPKVLYPL